MPIFALYAKIWRSHLLPTGLIHAAVDSGRRQDASDAAKEAFESWEERAGRSCLRPSKKAQTQISLSKICDFAWQIALCPRYLLLG
jgi:hypothetical protein